MSKPKPCLPTWWKGDISRNEAQVVRKFKSPYRVFDIQVKFLERAVKAVEVLCGYSYQ